MARPELSIEDQRRRKSRCRRAGGSVNTADTVPSQGLLRSRSASAQWPLVSCGDDNPGGEKAMASINNRLAAAVSVAALAGGGAGAGVVALTHDSAQTNTP